MTRMPLGFAMRLAVSRYMNEPTAGRLKVTPAELARRVSFPDKNVRRRLDGEQPMDAYYFEAICDALNVDVDEAFARARRIQDTEPYDPDTDLTEQERKIVARGRRRQARKRTQ